MRYAAARIAQAVPLLLLVSVAAFGVMHLAPGGPTTSYAHNPLVSASQIAAIRRLAPDAQAIQKILYGNAARVLKL